ncbi:MAG: hypothetical protein Q8N40_03720 [Bradyrhizobium sp.]|nr:hypothetical protein [Bradyrhizobium sp.]
MLAALLAAACCGGAPTYSLAEEAPTVDDFDWGKEKSTGIGIASSLSAPSFNFFDVGDLSYYSLYLVHQVLGSLSNATGVAVDRGLKSSSLSIVHDTKVFDRLRSEKQHFRVLGISDAVIESLAQRASDDTTTCLTMTHSDENGDIKFTIILLSEKFNNCLISGLLGSFGIRGTADVTIRTLTSACVLYEGRRRGLRDRRSLVKETPKLRDVCLAKALEKPSDVNTAK